MSIERVNYNPQHVRGEVKLDLIHPRTGLVLKSEKAENYIGVAMTYHNRWKFRSDYFVGNSTISDGEPNFPMGKVVLMSSNIEEPEPWAYAGGQMIAYGLKSAYSGADTKRGSLVAAETYANPEKVVWVWEWPTTAGNGLINSVGMVSESPGWWGTTADNPAPIAVRGLAVGSAITNTRGAIEYDPTLARMWIMSSSNLECWDVSNWSSPSLAFTGPTIAQMGLSGTVNGISHDATNLYVTSSGTATVRKFTKPTGSGDVTETGITVTGVSSITASAHDGTYIWVTNGTTIYRANSSSGAIERSFAKPFTETIFSMGWNSDRGLLIIGTSGKLVYTVDLDGVVVDKWTYCGDNSLGSDSYRGGITYVGSHTNHLGTTFKDCFIERIGSSGYNAATIATPDSLGSRTVFGSEVEKTNLTGMKLTYTFTFS